MNLRLFLRILAPVPCLVILANIVFAAGPIRPQLAAGIHSMALDVNGTLRTWGSDSYGQLGTGRMVQSAAPRAVVATGTFIKIAAGVGHSLALKSDGSLWTWGLNYYGQLGDATTTSRSTPVTPTR